MTVTPSMAPDMLQVRKTTLEGLRQRIDHQTPAPEVLTRKQFDKLDAASQYEYDTKRLMWFSSGLYVRTPAYRNINMVMQTSLRLRNPLSVGERGLVVTGPPHIGKTSALIKVAAQVEAHVAKSNPHFRKVGLAPVLYIEMEPNSTPKSIASSVLTCLGIDHNFKSSSQHQLTEQALDAMTRRSTRVLIIDELQMLKLDGRIGDDTINSLKTFMNGSGAFCIFSGVDLTNNLASKAAEQIMARCQITNMQPFSEANDASRSEWASLVNAFGDAMNLFDAEPGHLAPYADVLMGLAKGNLGNLRTLLSFAMSAALMEREETGHEAITHDVIASIGHVGLG